MYVIIVGQGPDAVAHGPFGTAPEAGRWAYDNVGVVGWYVAPLYDAEPAPI